MASKRHVPTYHRKSSLHGKSRNIAGNLPSWTFINRICDWHSLQIRKYITAHQNQKGIAVIARNTKSSHKYEFGIRTWARDKATDVALYVISNSCLAIMLSWYTIRTRGTVLRQDAFRRQGGRPITEGPGTVFPPPLRFIPLDWNSQLFYWES